VRGKLDVAVFDETGAFHDAPIPKSARSISNPNPQSLQIRHEAAAQAAAQAAQLEAERQRALAEAAKYERKQKQLDEKLAAKALEGEQLAAAKEALRARLRAMEGKLIKGEARGGLLEVTRKKEEEIARREAELARR